MRFPALAAGERLVCALDVRLALHPGEYTLVPQSGGLTGDSPDPGVLHDRVESLAPVLVTRPPGPGPAPFYGLAHLDTEIGWTALDR